MPNPPPHAGPTPRRRLKTQLALAFALVTALPAVGAVLLVVERSAQQRRTGLSLRLQENSAALCRSTDEFVARHLGGVATLAAGLDPAALADTLVLDRRLTRFHATYPTFVTTLAADRAGRVLAAHPPLAPDGRPARALGLTVPDRSYFQVPMRTRRPFISDAFRGRGLGSDPIVAVSAPVLDGAGVPVGIVEGSLDTRSFAELGSGFHNPRGASFVIADAAGQVVYASLGTPAPLTRLDTAALRSPGSRRPLARPPAGVPDLVRRCRTALGWTVYTRQPLAQLERDVRHQYRLGLLWVGLSLLVATVLALRLARYFTRPLDALVRAVQRFQGTAEPAPVATPGAAPAEVAQLIDGFQAMARRVAQSHRSLQAALEERAQLADALQLVVEEREAQVAARTSELMRANLELERLATEDPLTGLPNRRELLAAMDRAWRTARRERRPVALLMVDVDCFKQFNDHYGHPAGDRALRAVGMEVARLPRRPLDVAGRYGGEEFVLLLYDADAEAAGALAERLRRAVAALGLPHAASSAGTGVTVSIGLAAALAEDEHGVQQLIARADRALYRAKHGGRNQVAVDG